MPADQLTLTAHELATHVEAVIAGASLETSAAAAGIGADELADAVATYRAAALLGLHQRQDAAWFQAYVEPSNRANAETLLATHIAPRLDQLDNGHADWWFLRKHPGWRLRLRTADHPAAEAVFDDLAHAGTIQHWHRTIYEPESFAFGGTTAMAIVHDLFCADSRGVLNYTLHHPDLGRREISLLLISALFQHAGLDWFERGDVLARVAAMRPVHPNTDQARLDALTTTLRPLLAIPLATGDPPFHGGGPLAFATPWLAGFIEAGQRLGHAAALGQLDRGLRAILAHIVIFHWNRLGLTATAQGNLARAATAATLPAAS